MQFIETREYSFDEITSDDFPKNNNGPSLATRILSINNAEEPGDLVFDEAQYQITPMQQSFCALMVRGFSAASAARKIGISPNTVVRWQRQKWFQPEVDRLRNEWLEKEGIDKKREVFGPLAGQATAQLVKLMQSDDEKISLEASKYALDNFFDSKNPVGRPKAKVDVDIPKSMDDILNEATARILNITTGIQRDNPENPSIVASNS